MMDYTIFYKNSFNVQGKINLNETWDIFISTYFLDDRVIKVFNEIAASRKFWLVHPEYCFLPEEYPRVGGIIELINFDGEKDDESELIQNFFKKTQIDLKNKRFCVDITGFTRPSLIFFLLYLKRIGIKKFDAIYSEPDYYLQQEETNFSDRNVIQVRQVAGCEGKHGVDISNDILIIGTGYDVSLVNYVANDKEHMRRKIKIFGFPSLKADMYQENVLQVQKASESVGDANIKQLNGYCAPAHDPFVTASILQDIFADLDKDGKYTNVYLCPLGTKAQALGFALFYLTECINVPVSIIYPFCTKHEKKISSGLTKIWKYTIELS